MLTRVTQATVFDAFQRQVTSLQSRLASAQQTVATQKKLREASDDPAAADRVTRARGDQSQQAAFDRTVTEGSGLLRMQDALLEESSRILDRAREIASQQSNGLVTQADRQAAATEVEELERSLLQIANATREGRHLFGGLATGADPFTALPDPPGAYDPTTAYQGPAAAFRVDVAPGESVAVSTPGSAVFGGSPVTPGALEAIDHLRTDLEAGITPNARLGELDAAAERLLGERASVGGRLARLETRTTDLTRARGASQELIGSLEDADLTEAVTELTQLQNAYQATLASVQVLRTSLLDVFQP